MEAEQYQENLRRGMKEQSVTELGPAPSVTWRDMQDTFGKDPDWRSTDSQSQDIGGVARLLGLVPDQWCAVHGRHSRGRRLGFHIDGTFDRYGKDPTFIYSSELIVAVNVNPTIYFDKQFPIFIQDGAIDPDLKPKDDYFTSEPLQLKPRTLYYMPGFIYHDRPEDIKEGGRHFFRLARTVSRPIGHPSVVRVDDWDELQMGEIFNPNSNF